MEVLTTLPFRPLRQTILGTSAGMTGSVNPADAGNCFQTCIASLLGLDIDTVPHFLHLRNLAESEAQNELPWLDWLLARTWLRETHSLDFAAILRTEADAIGAPYLMTVRSHRGPWNHAVIAQSGAVIWDPSGLDDYTLADAVDDVAECICEPYNPDPVAQVDRWRAAARDEVA
jgi:hypothetical protein